MNEHTTMILIDIGRKTEQADMLLTLFVMVSVLCVKKKCCCDLSQFVNTHSKIAFYDWLDSRIAPHIKPHCAHPPQVFREPKVKI